MQFGSLMELGVSDVIELREGKLTHQILLTGGVIWDLIAVMVFDAVVRQDRA